MSFKGKRVGVIMGGPSSEREVSLNSGRGVFAALQKKGYDAVAIDWKGFADDLGARLRTERVDVAWIALHGTFGEDGCVQGLLECCGVPYTGSGVLASALAMDKVATRRIFVQLSDFNGFAVVDFAQRKEVVVHTVPLTGPEARARAEAHFRHLARRFIVGRGVA